MRSRIFFVCNLGPGQRPDTASYVFTTKKNEILEALLQAVLEEVRGLPAAIVLNEQTHSPEKTDILSRLKVWFAQGIADGTGPSSHGEAMRAKTLVRISQVEQCHAHGTFSGCFGSEQRSFRPNHTRSQFMALRWCRCCCFFLLQEPA